MQLIHSPTCPFAESTGSPLLLGQLGRLCGGGVAVYPARGATVEDDRHMAGWKRPLGGAGRQQWLADGQTGDDSAGRRVSC